MKLSIVFSVLVAIGVFVSLMGADIMMHEGRFEVIKTDKRTGKSSPTWGLRVIIASALVALATGAIGAVCSHEGIDLSNLQWLVWAMLAAIFAFMANLLIWGNEMVSSPKEAVPFAAADALFTMVGLTVTLVAEGFIRNALLASVVHWLPLILGIALLAFLFANALFYMAKEEKKTLYKVIAWVIIAVAAAGVILLAIFGLDWPGRQTRTEPEEPPADTSGEDTDDAFVPYYFHHEVLMNRDKLDDYDFGPDITSEVVHRKIAEGAFSDKQMDKIDAAFKLKIAEGEYKLEDLFASENKYEFLTAKDVYFALGEKEFFEVVTAEDVYQEFLYRLSWDPALAAGDVAYWDSLLHTDILGDFHVNVEGHEEDWMRDINGAAAAWATDVEAYGETLRRFVARLDHANVALVYLDKDMIDQMYMDGLSTDEVPKVIIMKTYDHGGFFLVFSETIKGTTVVDVAYRMDCGGQPTDCAKNFGVKAADNPLQPTPTKPSKPQGTSSGGKSSGGVTSGGVSSGGTSSGGYSSGGYSSGGTGGGTSSGGDPKITEPKRPSDSSQAGQINDNSGPGASTNNGVGARYSSEDEPSDSIHLTRPEREAATEALEDKNEVTRDKGEANTETYTPPASQDAEVHSNADQGTGNGNADTASDMSGKVSGTASNGTHQSVANDGAQGKMGITLEGN